MLKIPFKAVLSAFNRFWMSSINQSSKCDHNAPNEACPTSLVNSNVQSTDLDKLSANDAFGSIFDGIGNLIIAYISFVVFVIYGVFSGIELVGYLCKF